MVIKITPQQAKRVNALLRKLCANYDGGTCCWTTASPVSASRASASTASTATTSRMLCSRQTKDYMPR